MENVNKIKIRLDQIGVSGVTLSIPFGLDFYPIDNTELQSTEFVDKEKEKSINPIIDTEKFPFYPTFSGTFNILQNSFTVEYVLDKTLDFLGLTNDDITFNRNPFKRTYLRLNFYDTNDTKTQNLLIRETIHLHFTDDWFTDGKLNDQTTIPLTFKSNFQNLIYRSVYGEGYTFYWYKNELPKTLYLKISLMNAKDGNVYNLYSYSNGVIIPSSSSPSVPVIVTSNGYDYIKTDFYLDNSKREKFYYKFNDDSKSNILNIEDVVPINNVITINLNTY